MNPKINYGELRSHSQFLPAKMLNPSKNMVICYWCGSITQIIWVHGHGQCATCGTNIEECCKGEVCQVPTKQTQETIKNLYNDERKH